MNTSNRIRSIAVALVVCSAATVVAATAQEGAEQQSDLARTHYAEVRARYAADTWLRGARRAGLERDLALAGFVPGELTAQNGHLTRTYARTAADGAEPIRAFVVESIVADSAEGAHARLVDWLAGVQTQQTMPSTRELGLAVGDAGFVGPSGAAREALAWIAFVRGNVAVRVSAFDARRLADLDLAAVALAFDGAVQAAPVLPDGALLPRPAIITLAPERETLTAGDRTRVDFGVLDTTNREAHLVWDLAGEGQGYIETRSDGTYLFTTGAGVIELTLEATGALGTVTRRTVRVQVTEE